MSDIKIETTEDGSDTLYVESMDEHYHSTKGALTETNYIFIEMGLLAHTKKQVNVLEIGFGTGLNTIQTLHAAERNNRIVSFTTLELYPLEFHQVKKLSYSKLAFFEALHQAEWNTMVDITPCFSLHKLHLDFTTLPSIDLGKQFDVIYFDAFAPEKQPNMWSQQLFDHLYVLMNKGGILTTYCAKGVIRRMLQEAGFMVERLPGPPNGKREIIRATKL